MAIIILMDFLKEYWAIVICLAGILWHLIQQYFDYQRTKEKLASFEKTTSEYLTTFEKKNLDKYEELEREVKNHRKELEREIELARQTAKKEILQTKDELGSRIDKMFEVMSNMNNTITRMDVGFEYIKDILDDLKKKP